MSADGPARTASIDADREVDVRVLRLLALGCVLLLTASYVAVLRDITRVVGGTRSLYLVVAAAGVAAAILARTIRPRTATAGAACLVVAGSWYYLETTGIGLDAHPAIVADALTIATGFPLDRMIEAGRWTLGFAPGPVFLSWYLAVRERYAASVVPGGAALLVLVLTGDAGTTVALAGTLAALGAVAFGELERRGGGVAQADLLAVVVAAILVLSLSVSFVPGEAGGPGGSYRAGSLEGTIDGAPERSGISGQVDLSPEVRFTVEAEEPSYWRTGVYDRFADDEWIRSGRERSYDGRIGSPPGETETLEQRITVETALGVMPGAPQPVSLEGDVVDRAAVSTHGQPQPATTLREGDTYVVESERVDRDPDALRTAGSDYPEGVTEHFLQRPESSSSEFEAYAAEVTAGADNPYDAAVAIEDYLGSAKGYSLETDEPDGNAAEQFLFEMDEGFCVHFATTMTQLLRAQDVPARYVTGYTSGQQVDDGTYVVRGLDAHAWVEVYFPGRGWVSFDPTPSDDRGEVHDERLEEAREEGDENVDTDESEDVPVDEDDEGEQNRSEGDGGEENGSEPQEREDPGQHPDGSSEDDGGGGVPVPVTPGQVAAGLVAVGGAAGVVRRTNAVGRARRTIGLYRQATGTDPGRDVERAFERLERLLAREHRARRRAESRRQYVRSLAADRGIDERVERVAERYERAVYGPGVDRSTADETVALVDDLARERLPVVGRLRNGPASTEKEPHDGM